MEIVDILRQLANKQSTIKLLNIYKGLPVSYDTNITSVGGSEIQVPGNKNHIACLYYQGESYLQGEGLPFVIRSAVKSLNLAQNYAILTDFEVTTSNIGMREQVRVEPEEPLMSTIQFKGSSFVFSAPMADISANGGSLYFESSMFPNRLAQMGNPLTISISIPDGVIRKIKKPAIRGEAKDGLNPKR